MPMKTPNLKPKYVLLNEDTELFSYVVVDQRQKEHLFLLTPFRVVHLNENEDFQEHNVIDERIGLHKWPYYCDNAQVPVFQKHVSVVTDLNNEFSEFYLHAVKTDTRGELDLIGEALQQFNTKLN